MEGLIVELDDLSRRNDILVMEKEADLLHIMNLEGEVKEYRRKYEAAKTELRSLKGKLWIYRLKLFSYPFHSDIAAISTRSKNAQLGPVTNLCRWWYS